MADLTMGFPFAFQTLGYLYDAGVSDLSDLMPDYDAMLAESVYLKVWIELSGVDRQICHQIADSNESIDSVTLRQRFLLQRKCILSTNKDRTCTFALPQLREFVHKADS